MCEYCGCVCPHLRPAATSDLNVRGLIAQTLIQPLKPVAFEAGQAPWCLRFNLALCLLPWQPAASTAAARKSHRSGNAGGILKRQTLVQGWAPMLNSCSYRGSDAEAAHAAPSAHRESGAARPKSVKGC